MDNLITIVYVTPFRTVVQPLSRLDHLTLSFVVRTGRGPRGPTPLLHTAGALPEQDTLLACFQKLCAPLDNIRHASTGPGASSSFFFANALYGRANLLVLRFTFLLLSSLLLSCSTYGRFLPSALFRTSKPWSQVSSVLPSPGPCHPFYRS